MYAPHTVTVYNILHTVNPDTMEDIAEMRGTILRGVFFDAAKAANVRQSGMVGADAVNVYIPFAVDARDAITGGWKMFAKPSEYRSSADRTAVWTLSVSDCGIETVIIRGEYVTEDETEARLHDESYRITSVDLKDFGRPSMWHWECGGA